MYNIDIIYESYDIRELFDETLDLFYTSFEKCRNRYTYAECDLDNVAVVLNDIYTSIKNNQCKNLVSIHVSKSGD